MTLISSWQFRSTAITLRPPCQPRRWDLPDVVHLPGGGHWRMARRWELSFFLPPLVWQRERHRERADTVHSCRWHTDDPWMTQGVCLHPCIWLQETGDMKLTYGHIDSLELWHGVTERNNFEKKKGVLWLNKSRSTQSRNLYQGPLVHLNKNSPGSGSGSTSTCSVFFLS